jgi:integrase
MPLKIIPSRNAKSKSLYIRGSYLGVKVDESCRTDRHSIARIVRKRIEQQIERGTYKCDPVVEPAPGPTFLDAAKAYLEAGRSPRYVAPLAAYFAETPLAQIDQAAIDRAAMTLHPTVTNATRNAYVYTPASAILHHAGDQRRIKRPPGAKGRVVTDWLNETDAFGIIAAAETIDQEFATLLVFLLYTGPRINGALNLRRADIQIDKRMAWARPQKGQANNAVRLTEDLCARLAALLGRRDQKGDARERVFRWRYGGQLKHLLTRAKLAYLGLPCPVRRPNKWREPPNRLKWVTFHIFRHTWATWMRQHGTDDIGLVATGNWRSKRSAARYAHAAPRQEWDRVDQLPAPSKRGTT